MVNEIIASMKTEPENWRMKEGWLENEEKKIYIRIFESGKHRQKTIGTVILDDEDTYVELNRWERRNWHPV